MNSSKYNSDLSLQNKIAGRLNRMATTWFNNGKEHPPIALERIISYFHRMNRPLYLGFVSLEIGYSLDQTMSMLLGLQESGLIRPLTIEEKKDQKLDPRGDIWILVDIARLDKANS